MITKKHSTLTKQDRTMRFSRRSSSNSLLESSTCRAPLGRRNGGLFWTFGILPESPCISTSEILLTQNNHFCCQFLQILSILFPQRSPSLLTLWTYEETDDLFIFPNFIYSLVILVDLSFQLKHFSLFTCSRNWYICIYFFTKILLTYYVIDRLCDLVVRVSGYR